MILGLLLAPGIAALNISVEAIRYAGQPTTVSLYLHVLFVLLCLLAANSLVGRLRPRWRMAPSELIVVYFFVLMAAVMSSHDQIEVLVPIISYPFRYGNAANRWNTEITPYLPAWLTVRDPDAIARYYIGNANLWATRDLLIWARPVLLWTGFLTVLAAGMFCLNVLLRKQWNDHERLSYPLAQLPIDLVQPRAPIFGHRGFWIAFGLACTHDMLFGLHALWPSFPEPYTRYQLLNQYVTEAPWTALPSIPIAFFPWIAALGVLLPVDLLLSCAVFFWVWKLQPVIATGYGYTDIPNFPFVFEQSFGAYMAIALYTLYTARHALAHGFACIWRGSDGSDQGEALSYRAASIGLLLCLAGAFAFFYACGMTPWVIVAALAIYVVAAIAITRLRAELGTPAHDLGQMGPMRLIPNAFGTQGLSRVDLATLGVMHGFNRNYRACQMAVNAEGLRAASKTGTRQSVMFWVLLLAVFWGALSGFVANIHLHYAWGAASKADAPYVSTIFGREPYEHVTNLIRNGVSPAQHRSVLGAMGVGFLVATALGAMRLRFAGFLLHPVGYAISSNWCMTNMWLSITVAWIIKSLLVKYGGLRAYRRAVPICLGVILGECVMGTIWMLISTFTGQKTFIVWPYG